MNALSGVAVFLIIMTPVQPAITAAIALREGSTDWAANAFAGETAKAYDASTAYSNPAGMTRLNWNEADLSSTAVLPSSQFSGVNTIGGHITPGNLGGPLCSAIGHTQRVRGVERLTRSEVWSCHYSAVWGAYRLLAKSRWPIPKRSLQSH
jgi:hypothetical protein